MNKKGFTLMEILAVLMVVALVASMAVPVFRYIRRETRYNQTRSAAVKMADALRSYYQQTKGQKIEQGCFAPTEDLEVLYATACNDVVASGVPGNQAGTTADLDQLFACGYLNYRDFAGLPYKFCVCNPNGASTNTDCDDIQKLLVRVKGTERAGETYQNKRIAISHNMTITESEVEE